MFFWGNYLQAQVKVVDIETQRLGESNFGTENSVYSSLLEDQRVKVTFRNSKNIEDEYDFGAIYITSLKDFEVLYNIIAEGFGRPSKIPIHVDLGDSKLTLYYEKMLFGGAALKIHHYYKSSPYTIKSTPILYIKEVKKIFGIKD